PHILNIYTLSLHDALPILFEGEIGLAIRGDARVEQACDMFVAEARQDLPLAIESPTQAGAGESGVEQLQRNAAFEQAIGALGERSEEHTSELQSRGHLVCR